MMGTMDVSQQQVKPSQIVRTGRSFDRLVNFTDAVVAVAVTLMLLPLLDIVAPTGDQTVWELIKIHWTDFMAYGITFWVIVAIWLAHHRTMDRIEGYDSPVVVWNTLWLATIAFLPWPTSMLGDGTGYNHGVGVLYFGTLAVNNLCLSMLALHIERTPALWVPGRQSVSIMRGFIFTGAWVFMMIVAEVLPDQLLTAFLLIWVAIYAIAPLRRVMRTKD